MASDESRELQLANLVDDFQRQTMDGRAPSIEEFARRNAHCADDFRAVIHALGLIQCVANDSDRAFDPPERLGPYRVLREIARGGMGVVLEAVHEPRARSIALKLLYDDRLTDVKHTRRFNQEAQLISRCRHPNIVAAYDAGVCEGVPYLALELLHGDDLRRYVEAHGPVPLSVAADVIAQAAAGLRYAHSLGIVHRDVKPSNIYLESTGSVKILDLGLALDVDSNRDLTSTRFVVGTRDYLAPEQARNSRDVDARTDVYGLGATFYFALTGRILRDTAADARELLAARLEAAAVDPVWRLIRKMTAADAAARHADMAEVLEELKALPIGSECQTINTPPQAIQQGDGTDDGRSSPTTTALPTSRVTDALGFRRLMRRRTGSLAIGLLIVVALTLRFCLGTDASSSDPVPPPSSLRDRQGLEFVLIEPGEFTMGLSSAEVDEISRVWRGTDNRAALQAEVPARRMNIPKPYYLACKEVTLGQFREFVEETGYQTDAERDRDGAYGWDESKQGPVVRRDYSWRNTGWPQSDDHPVVNVSWNDAAEFCAWKSRREGATYRLPSEAEWEFACGRDAAASGRFNTADSINRPDGDLRKSHSDPFRFTSPVGSFPANARGLHDMIGNVWEWCEDWHAAGYGTDDVGAAKASSTATHRAVRGGSWNSTLFQARPTCRAGATKPDDCGYGLGFRVLREL